jgi:hypothetical protein
MTHPPANDRSVALRLVGFNGRVLLGCTVAATFHLMRYLLVYDRPS